MFHHVVLMKFTRAAGPEFHRAVNAYCERVLRAEPHPHRYIYRPNIASRSDGLDHGIVAIFGSAAEHDQYQASSVHQEMKAYMAPFIERIVVCDIDEGAA